MEQEEKKYLEDTVKDAIVPYWALLGIIPDLNTIEKGKVTLLLPMNNQTTNLRIYKFYQQECFTVF